MASSRMERRVPASTLDNRPSPLGWVWIHRTPHSRSSLRTSRTLGMDTLPLSPMEISTTRPSRDRYTEISRPICPVKPAMADNNVKEANVSASMRS